MKNSVKEKLQAGQNVIGCFTGFFSEAVVEMLGYGGFDFVVIDNEHGSFTWGEVEQLIRAAQMTQMVPIVRVAYGPSDIQKALDRGAPGLHVPMISTREEAEWVVRRAKFPPLGQRGTAYSVRAARYGKDKGRDYLQSANDGILTVIHIETVQGVENIEEIVLVPGLDVCFVGPTDLSVSLGYADEGPGHPEVKKTMNHIMKACRKVNLPVGTMIPSAKGIAETKEWGAQYITVQINSLLTPAIVDFVNKGRQEE